MTGKEFRIAFENSGMNGADFAEKTGVARSSLYRLFDEKKVDSFYVDNFKSVSCHTYIFFVCIKIIFFTSFVFLNINSVINITQSFVFGFFIAHTTNIQNYPATTTQSIQLLVVLYVFWVILYSELPKLV